MENKFWLFIEEYEEENKIVPEINIIYKNKIFELCGVICEYFKKDDPRGERFYSDPSDCYDGLYLGSQALYEFMRSIILSGKDAFNQFKNNPFDGDIMNYVYRGVSCGNSSCLYLNDLTCKKWIDESGFDPVIMAEDGIDFLNKISDIVL